MPKQFISKNTLYRLPLYLSFLKCLPAECDMISATSIAESLNFNHVQVRKDLASVSDGGRPRVGYKTTELIADLERFFLRKISDNVVIVGMGPLGYALALSSDYKAFGFNVVAAFDHDERVIGKRCGDIEILPVSRLYDFCNAGGVRLGIITTPQNAAQKICDTLTESGAIAIWNFSSAKLHVPEDVLVYDENLTASLAILAAHIKQSR